jgi:hypothetical protein
MKKSYGAVYSFCRLRQFSDEQVGGAPIASKQRILTDISRKLTYTGPERNKEQ